MPPNDEWVCIWVRLCSDSIKILSQFHFIALALCFLSWKEEEWNSVITYHGIFKCQHHDIIFTDNMQTLVTPKHFQICKDSKTDIVLWLAHGLNLSSFFSHLLCIPLSFLSSFLLPLSFSLQPIVSSSAYVSSLLSLLSSSLFIPHFYLNIPLLLFSLLPSWPVFSSSLFSTTLWLMSSSSIPRSLLFSSPSDVPSEATITLLSINISPSLSLSNRGSVSFC